MDFELINKVFFIAGSSSGIGLGIAECYLKEGAKVVITGRNANVLHNSYCYLSKKYGEEKILALKGDMQNLKDIKEALLKAADKFGSLDGIIANIGSGSEPLIPIDSSIWDESFSKNLKASMLLVQEGVMFLKKSGGSIVFISSIAGVEDIAAPLAYSIHKAGIVAASKKLSRRLGAQNIRVNVVVPGNIIFPGGTWDNKNKENPQEIKSYIESEVPLRSFGTPDDIGNICVFLSSVKSKFISGSVINVDGGQTRSF